jgi:demethylmenaquinone methyltransferase/2-methoxy-6-polyprenyl-1,4-benzoquinol methylase
MGNAMPAKDPRVIQTMFGRIVPRYDLLNRLMSLGMDRRWRRLAAEAARPDGALALDVGAGTGDLAFELRRLGARRVIGIDFSLPMLAVASQKARGLAEHIDWALADALRLPFSSETFDCVTNAFVLRNLSDLKAGLTEMARVLKPGGRLVCLDMTPPPPGPFGALYALYFSRLVPLLAGAISGDRAAYRYLPNSLKGFPKATALAALIRETGLSGVRVRYLAGRTVALHVAHKPGAA